MAGKRFRWGIFGCDARGGDVGELSVAPDELVLLPLSGAESFAWVSPTSNTQVVEQIVIARNDDTSILAAGPDFMDVWSLGAECVGACGGDGPSEPTVACDAPDYLPSW